MTEELFTETNISCALNNLKAKEDSLRKYEYLQQSLKNRDISSDPEYQTMFKNYYVVRRGQDWCKPYFLILQQEKTNENIHFHDVLEKMWDKTTQFEASFSSKLIATINPCNPVWDKNVLGHLKLSEKYEKIKRIKFKEERMEETIALYSEIQNKTEKILCYNGFQKWQQCFNGEFSKLRHFTDIKILDMFLWQLR